MSERCRCGADLLADLPFCVTCGQRRTVPSVVHAPRPAAGAFPHPAMRSVPAQRAAPRPAVPTGWSAPLRAGDQPVGAVGASGPRPPTAPFAPAHHGSTRVGPAPFGPGSFGARPFDAAPFGPAYPGPTPHAAPGRSSAPWIVAAVGVVVVAVVAAVLVVTLRPGVVYGTAPASAPVVVQAAPSTVQSAAEDAVGDVGETGESTLQSQVDTDRGSAEGLAGQWVPQLSSKRPGTVDNGTSYDASTILGHYNALASAHPGALMLWSGDWSVYRESDYWVVVAGQGFTTAAGANAWCSASGFDADDCFAKKLSHTSDPAGTTVPR